MNSGECTEEQGLTEYRGRPIRTNRLWNQVFGRQYYSSGSNTFTPAVEVNETVDEYRIWADLPGVLLEDVETTLAKGHLIITGHKKSPLGEEAELCSCSERNFGHFQRVIHLSDSVDQGNISATMKNGVLEVTLPKKEEAKPRKIEIND